MLIPSHLQLEPSNSRTRVPAGGIDLIASIDFKSDGATTATLSSSTKVSQGDDAISNAEVATPNHSNQQYSIYAITDAAANIAERYAYTAYGQPTILDAAATVIATSAISNRYTYTAREWDAAVGLYHFRARWMSGLTGRFLSRDPIGYRGSPFDLYEFADGNPSEKLDPLGLCPKPCEEKDRRSERQCCKDSRNARVVDKEGNVVPLVRGVVGLTFCCDGRAVTCVYPEIFRGRYRSPMALSIVEHCIKKHEKSHVPDIGPCKDECPSIEEARFPNGGKTEEGSECDARQVELDCLARLLWLCLGDSQCLEEVNQSAKEIYDRKKCPQLVKRRPLDQE